MLRDMQGNLVGKLIVVPGIITSASRSVIRAVKQVYRCSNCGHEKELKGKYGFGGTRPPRICDN